MREDIPCTAIAIGYSACVGIMGGLTPLAATWLDSRAHDDLSPAFLVAAAAAASFAGMLARDRGTRPAAGAAPAPARHMPDA